MGLCFQMANLQLIANEHISTLWTYFDRQDLMRVEKLDV